MRFLEKKARGFLALDSNSFDMGHKLGADSGAKKYIEERREVIERRTDQKHKRCYRLFFWEPNHNGQPMP